MTEENREEDLIEKAQKAAERLEAANKNMAETLAKMEAIEARRVLGGQSTAGVRTPEISKEEKDKIDMKNYFKGTAIERALK